MLSGAAAAGVTVHGDAVLVDGSSDVYRYTFDGAFDGAFGAGDVDVEFIDGAWLDSDGVASTTESESFRVRGVRTELVGIGAADVVGVGLLNARGYVDVRFTATNGATLDVASILDGEAELTLTGSAATNVVLDGAPTAIGNGVFRYAFTGAFVPGTVDVEFSEDAARDTSAFGNSPEAFSFFVDAPSVGLLSPQPEQRADRSALNDNGYIDIQFEDRTGRGLDAA